MATTGRGIGGSARGSGRRRERVRGDEPRIPGIGVLEIDRRPLDAIEGMSEGLGPTLVRPFGLLALGEEKYKSTDW